MGRRRRGWTQYEEELLRELWPDHTATAIAQRLGCSRSHVQIKARALGLAKGRFTWTDELVEILRRRYPHERTDRIAEDLGLSPSQLHTKAWALGLRKTRAFRASPESGCITKGDPRSVGAKSRFKRGHVPANKDKRRPGWAPGRMAETWFKSGRPASEARNYVPIGTEKYDPNRKTLVRKVTDDPSIYPAARWRPVHVLVWEAVHGPVPEGHVVIFRKGMKTIESAQITVDRLELVTRQELMRRNTIQRYPADLRDAMQLIGRVKRKIHDHEEHQ